MPEMHPRQRSRASSPGYSHRNPKCCTFSQGDVLHRLVSSIKLLLSADCGVCLLLFSKLPSHSLMHLITKWWMPMGGTQPMLSAPLGDYATVGLSATRSNAAQRAATGTVTIQVTTMLRNTPHFTLDSPASVMPTATMLPIWQWVEETGMPTTLAMTTLSVAPSSMANPLEKLMLVISLPTVFMTL